MSDTHDLLMLNDNKDKNIMSSTSARGTVLCLLVSSLLLIGVVISHFPPQSLSNDTRMLISLVGSAGRNLVGYTHDCGTVGDNDKEVTSSASSVSRPRMNDGVLRVVIVSRPRSGSSFTLDTVTRTLRGLNQLGLNDDNVFGMFESVGVAKMDQFKLRTRLAKTYEEYFGVSTYNGKLTDLYFEKRVQALLVNELMTCNLTANMDDLGLYTGRTCRTNDYLTNCTLKQLENRCVKSKAVVLKSVLLEYRTIMMLSEINEALLYSIRFIVLVRNPMNELLSFHTAWDKNFAASVQTVCDLYFAETLTTMEENLLNLNVHMLLYESLSENFTGTAYSLGKFLTKDEKTGPTFEQDILDTVIQVKQSLVPDDCEGVAGAQTGFIYNKFNTMRCGGYVHAQKNYSVIKNDPAFRGPQSLSKCFGFMKHFGYTLPDMLKSKE